MSTKPLKIYTRNTSFDCMTSLTMHFPPFIPLKWPKINFVKKAWASCVD